METTLHVNALVPIESEGNNNATPWGFNPSTRHSIVYNPLMGSFFAMVHPDESVKSAQEITNYEGSRVIEIPLYNAMGDELGSTSDTFNTNSDGVSGTSMPSQIWLYNVLEVKMSVRQTSNATQNTTIFYSSVHNINTGHFTKSSTFSESRYLSSLTDDLNSAIRYDVQHPSTYSNTTLPFLTPSTTEGVDGEGNLKNTFSVFFDPSLEKFYLKYYLYNNGINSNKGAYIKGIFYLY
jgi:hypothetical protein